MIYHLFRYLERAGVDIPGMGLMHYLSFRAMMATVAAVLFTLLVGKRIIRILQRHQIGDVPRDLGLDGAEGLRRRLSQAEGQEERERQRRPGRQEA